MGIPHKTFYCKRIIKIFSVLMMCFLNVNVAFAYGSLFVVEDVKIDITDENSVSAQEKAFEQAQVMAFKILAQRMVEEAQVATMETPDSLTISSLIKDYEVTDEQISAVRYVGTYRFRFREEAVSKFFSVSGLTFSDTSSKPLLVLPIFQKDGKNTLWSEGNMWMQAWASAQLSGGLVPIEVPIGDLMDIADIDENQALAYERLRLDRMLGRYGAKEAAIMIAVPDVTLAQISNQSEVAIGRLRISIYRTDRAQAEHVQDIMLLADGAETVGGLYGRAVDNAYKALQTDWKSKTQSNAAESQYYFVRVLFRDIRQWVQIQQSLGTMTALSEMSIRTMKSAEAYITFKFRGNEGHLRDALNRSNMTLGQGYPYGATVNEDGEYDDNNSYILYDLTYGRTARQNPAYTPDTHRNYQKVEPASGGHSEPRYDDEGFGVHTF